MSLGASQEAQDVEEREGNSKVKTNPHGQNLLVMESKSASNRCCWDGVSCGIPVTGNEVEFRER